MGKYLINDTTLTGIANAIRNKTNTTGSIRVSDFASRINGITVGEGGSTGGDIDDTKMETVCLYYGYPIAFQGIWDVDAVCDAYKKYDICVFGNHYQQPSHESYADTVRVLAKLREVKPTAKIVGYVPIGMETINDEHGLPMSELKNRVDQWFSIGANGIFLDEFGYDYNVSRERQNEIVSYCHNKGMFVIANSWQPEYCFGTEDIYLDWINFHGNPNNIECELGANDYYLFENMFYASDEEDDGSITTEFTSSSRLVSASEYASKYRDVYGTKSISLDAIPSTFTDDEKNEWISLSMIGSAILDIDAVSFGDEHLNSRGNYYEWSLPDARLKPALGNVTTDKKSGTDYPYFFERNVGGNRYSIEYNFTSSSAKATENGVIKFCGNPITNLWLNRDEEYVPPVWGDNLLFSSIEADGTPYNNGRRYKDGYYLRSSGKENEYSGTSVSGYMPVSYGQTISFENIGTYASSSYFDGAEYCKLALYDTNKNNIATYDFSSWYYSENNATVRDDRRRLTTITLNNSVGAENIKNVAYFRISFASSEVSENSVVSVSGGSSTQQEN